MRTLVLALLSTSVMACGSSAKKTQTATQVERETTSDRSPTKPQPGGDVTLSTNTNDDLSWLRPVYFSFDSSELLPETRDTLGQLHDWLIRHPATTLTIEGHCDEHGTTEYNIGLGQRRAQSMVDYLTKLGIASKRLGSVSYGAERPAADGHDEIAWAKNRRGEFRVGQ